jgi:hypothetical protein
MASEKHNEEEVKVKPKLTVKPYVTVNQPKFKKLPRIIGGICEFCGIPATKCEHYKDVNIMCSYCLRPITDKDILGRELHVIQLGDTDIEMCCDDYKCRQKFNAKYRPQI